MKYEQKYRKAWEDLPNFKGWLTQCENVKNKAFCKYCQQIIVAKKVDISRHLKTPKHQKNADPYKNSAQQKLTTLNQKPNLSKLKSQANLATFVAVHTSFRSIDHLSDLCNNTFHDSKSCGFKMHRSKCSSIIANVLGPFFEKKLSEDLQTNKFSLFLDESTDISMHKLLGVCVRYFCKRSSNIENAFLGFVELENGTALEICNGLKRYYI